MWHHPLPLPVGTPFGIHMHAKQVKRPLAPGMQAAQGIGQLLALPVATGTVQLYRILQVVLFQRQRRHGLYRVHPARQVTMAGIKALIELVLYRARPVFKRCAVQMAGKGSKVDHGKAIREAKLMHWNHRCTRLKPASCRRWRCSSRLSGSMTFSMARRFWAISSSL